MRRKAFRGNKAKMSGLDAATGLDGSHAHLQHMLVTTLCGRDCTQTKMRLVNILGALGRRLTCYLVHAIVGINLWGFEEAVLFQFTWFGGRALACLSESLGTVGNCLYYSFLFPVVDKSDLKIGK